MTTRNITTMTKAELLLLPIREWKKVGFYDSILLFPSKHKHESGFAEMIIIGVVDDEAVEIAADGPDDINWYSPAPSHQFMANLRTDCVWKSRVLHYWSPLYRFCVGPSLSSVDIRLVPKSSPSF